MDPLAPIIGWSIVIIAIEWITWHLFRQKTVRVCFPAQSDLKLFQILTLGRMRLLALVHAVFVVAIVTIAHITLW